MTAELGLRLTESDLEAQLVGALQAELDACASLLTSARETQRAILALDPDAVAYTSQQQLKALTALHRTELRRKSILMSWANAHAMAFSTVTIMDIAGRVTPAAAEQLVRLAQAVADRLAELSSVNRGNRSLVKSELELQRAIWQHFMDDGQAGTMYGPTGPLHRDQGVSRLVEYRA